MNRISFFWLMIIGMFFFALLKAIFVLLVVFIGAVVFIRIVYGILRFIFG